MTTKLGSACVKLGCSGTYREMPRARRDGYSASHPFGTIANSTLTVAECDACGMQVIGLQAQEEARPTDT
jgi:hypothetical protein